MKALRGFSDAMVWVETGKRAYELHAGADAVARLTWPKGFGSPGHGETSDGKVTIERTGLLKPRVVLSEDVAGGGEAEAPPASQRAPLISLEVDFGGRGVARTRTEKTLSWVPGNMWRTQWGFEEGGKTLATFESDSAMKFGHKVKVLAGDAPDLGALVLLGSAIGVFLTEDAAIFGI
jgi:hypothetical protein